MECGRLALGSYVGLRCTVLGIRDVPLGVRDVPLGVPYELGGVPYKAVPKCGELRVVFVCGVLRVVEDVLRGVSPAL